MQQKQFLEGIYSYTSLPQEIRKISSKQSNVTPKGTREKIYPHPKTKEKPQ